MLRTHNRLGGHFFAPDRVVTRRCLARSAFFFLALLAVSLSAPGVGAQNSLHLVYLSSADSHVISGFTVDPTSGASTAIPGSPFQGRLDPHGIAIDPTGRFLYAVNVQANDVSAFSIDPATGALSELESIGSPFAGPATGGTPVATNPLGIAIDASGQFLYVVEATSSNAAGSGADFGTLICFRIDQTTGALSPTSTASVDLDSPPIAPLTLLADPVNEKIYVAGNNAILQEGDAAFLDVFQVDPSTGNLSGPESTEYSGYTAYSAAISPNGNTLFGGIGENAGEVVINGVSIFGYQDSATGSFPEGMAVDSTGTYLYVAFNPTSLTVLPIASLPTQTPGVQLPITTEFEPIVADANAPFLYIENAPYQVASDGTLTALPLLSTPSSVTGVGTYDPSGSGQPDSAPIATLNPASLSFDTEAIGTTSSAQSIALTNTGNADLSISGASITGANLADFVIQSDSCPAVLTPTGGCSFAITFKASVAGSESASLTISDNVSGGSSSAELSGSGFAPAPAVTLLPGSLTFPSTNIGVVSATQSVAVTNSGTAVLHVSANGGVVLSGPNPLDFSIQTDTCTGAAVAVSANCSISVSFDPIAFGTRSAQIQITDDAQPPGQTVSLSGTGTSPPGPSASVSPNTLNFSGTAPGTASAAQTVTITNVGTAALHVAAVALAGTNPGDFQQTNSCAGATVAISSSCQIAISFFPTVAGSRSAQLQISDDAPGTPQTVSLSGTGTGPTASLSSSSLNFTSDQGVTSAAQTVTVTNSGTAALHIITVMLAGANAGEFQQTNTCVGTAVASSGSCQVSVSFDPTATGLRSAQLQITDDAPGSSQMVSLSGNGSAPFTITPSGGTSQTVAAGGAVQYTLQLTPASGFSGSVSLSCAVSPQGPVCTVPSSQAADGSFIVTVSTNARSAAERLLPSGPWERPSQEGWLIIWSSGLIGCCLLIELWYEREKIKSLLPWHATLKPAFFALLLTISLALVSCGGGSQSTAGTSSGGTAAGAYSVIVTASANGATQNYSLSLTVQ